MNESSIFSKRTIIPVIDALKFFFCLCVIAQHTKLFSFSDELYFFTSKAIFKLAVPFFFVTSGFFLGRKLKKAENKTAIVFDYCKRLLMPFLVFSLINIFERAGAMILSGRSFFYILMHVGQAILFYPYGALWYLQASIIGALLLLPFLLRNKIDMAVLIGAFFYTFALLCDNYYGLITSGGVKQVIDLYMKYCVSPRNGLFVGFLFLSIGIKCADYEVAYYRNTSVFRKNVFLLMLIYGLYLTEVLSLRRYVTANDDGSLFLLLPFLAPIMLKVSLGINLGRNGKVTSWLYENSVVLRNLSTGMYLLHRPVLFFISYVVNNNVLCFLIVSLIVIIICLLAYRSPKGYVCKLLK